jgi:hypothetical protein
MAAKRTSGHNPPDWFRFAGGGGRREADARKQSEQGPGRQADRYCNARKGHEIVAVSFSNKNHPAALIAVRSANLFFVRVNQVLVRLWARAMEAERCSVFVPSFG